MSGDSPPPPAAPVVVDLGGGTCDDCGQGFKGPVTDHYKAAHAGMPRYRWTEKPGVSWIACAEPGCGVKMNAAKARTSNGKSDPIDAFGAHLSAHQED